MEIYDKSFPEAMEMSISEEEENTSRLSGKWDEGSQAVCPIPKPELKFPERNEDCKRVRESYQKMWRRYNEGTVYQ